MASIIPFKRDTGEEPEFPIAATPFVWTDPARISMRSWLLRPHYIRKFASATIAHPSVGKSTLAIVETLSMVTGKALLDVKPEGKLKVWYWNGEDPKEELDRRFAAAALHYHITPKDIGDRLFVDSGRTLPIVIAEDERGGIKLAEPVIAEVTATLLDNEIDVLIIDPFVSCHHVGENNNTGIERVAKSWAHIAEAANCAVALAHHSRKTYGNEVTIEDSRGASALNAAVRASRSMNTMNSADAENLGIADEKRHGFFRVDNARAALTRRSELADWYQFELVALDNDPTGQTRGDEVGVVARWEVPENSHTGVSATMIRKIQAAIKGGRWRADQRSKVELWAGEPFADAIGADITKKMIRDWVTKGLRELVKAGYLKEVIDRDDNRKKRAYIEPGKKPEDEVEIRF